MKKLERIKKVCETCGTNFLVLPRRSNAKYCSLKCFGTDPKRDKTRPNNGKNFGVPWAKGKTKYTDEKVAKCAKNTSIIIQEMYDTGKIDLSKRKTDYKALGLKVSDTISRKLANGTLRNQHRFVKGWYKRKDGTEEFYESSYEKKYMEMLDGRGDRWTKRHGIRIQYFNPRKQRMSYYVPDFFINSSEIHEIKPAKRIGEPENIAKIQAGEQYCLTNNFKYRIITEINLNIKL